MFSSIQLTGSQRCSVFALFPQYFMNFGSGFLLSFCLVGQNLVCCFSKFLCCITKSIVLALSNFSVQALGALKVLPKALFNVPQRFAFVSRTLIQFPGKFCLFLDFFLTPSLFNNQMLNCNEFVLLTRDLLADSFKFYCIMDRQDTLRIFQYSECVKICLCTRYGLLIEVPVYCLVKHSSLIFGRITYNIYQFSQMCYVN